MGSMQGAPMNGGPLICLHILLNVFLMANCKGGVCQTNLMFADMLWSIIKSSEKVSSYLIFNISSYRPNKILVLYLRQSSSEPQILRRDFFLSITATDCVIQSLRK